MLTCNEAIELLDLWLPKFGFDHYRRHVEVVSEDAKGKVWARCHWNHEDEHVRMQFVPDGTLPRPQLEAVVVHELAHGLCSLSEESIGAEERVCNRIVRLALRREVKLANEWSADRNPLFWDTFKALSIDPAAAPMLRVLIDALPEEEREVVNRRFYERQSLGDIAEDMGWSAGNDSDRKKVIRVLQRAMARLAVELAQAELVSED